MSLIAALSIPHSLRFGGGWGGSCPLSSVTGKLLCFDMQVLPLWFQDIPPSCCSPYLTVRHTETETRTSSTIPPRPSHQPLEPPNFLRWISALSGGIHTRGQDCSFPPAPSLAVLHHCLLPLCLLPAFYPPMLSPQIFHHLKGKLLAEW